MSAATDLEPTGTADARAKRPFLRRVRIRGYKSIAFCDVTLEPLTILVGRNASGKSNFLDALGFLADLIDMRATDAVDQRGGWRFVHCRNSTTPYIEVEIEATLAGFRPTLHAEYSVTLTEGQHNQVQVFRESLILSERFGSRRCGYRVADDRIEWIGGSDDWSVRSGTPHHTQYDRQQYKSRLLLGLIGSQPIAEMGEELRASHIHNFSPGAMRAPKPITGASFLTRDGSNLARAVEGLLEIDPRAVARVQQYLANVVPEIESFQRSIVGNDYETIQFQLRSPTGSTQTFDAASMSDGTLRVLAALVAVNQIYMPTNASGFVGIEEPETSLHPAAMRALVDALDEATLRTQILLTTHSAEMLDNPTIRPENIRVVQMIDGQTVIAPVDEASVEIVRRKLDTLGGLERQNQLEPDLDDLDRQRALYQNGQDPKP